MSNVRSIFMTIGTAILFYTVLESQSLIQLPESFSLGEQLFAGLTLMLGVLYGRIIGGILLLIAILLSLDAFSNGESIGYVVARTFALAGILFYMIGNRKSITTQLYRRRSTGSEANGSYRRYMYDETPVETEFRRSLHIGD